MQSGLSVGGDWAANDLTFMVWFGLSSGRAKLLSALWAAQGDLVESRSLGLSRHTVYVYVSDLRTALYPGAIHTRSKFGYALTISGLAECAAALEAMSWDALAAGCAAGRIAA